MNIENLYPVQETKEIVRRSIMECKPGERWHRKQTFRDAFNNPYLYWEGTFGFILAKFVAALGFVIDPIWNFLRPMERDESYLEGCCTDVRFLVVCWWLGFVRISLSRVGQKITLNDSLLPDPNPKEKIMNEAFDAIFNHQFFPIGNLTKEERWQVAMAFTANVRKKVDESIEGFLIFSDVVIKKDGDGYIAQSLQAL